MDIRFFIKTIYYDAGRRINKIGYKNAVLNFAGNCRAGNRHKRTYKNHDIGSGKELFRCGKAVAFFNKLRAGFGICRHFYKKEQNGGNRDNRNYPENGECYG